MSAIPGGESLKIVLVFKNTDTFEWLPAMLTALGHVVVATYSDLIEYSQRLPSLVPFPDVVMTNYTGSGTLKKLQGILRSRGGVAAFILVGRDRSILNAQDVPYIFGRLPLPALPQCLGTLELEAKIIDAVGAFRITRSRELARAAEEQRQVEVREREQALDILMELRPKKCPTRPDAERHLTRVVTSWQGEFTLVKYVRWLIECHKRLDPKPGNPDNKKRKKPRS